MSTSCSGYTCSECVMTLQIALNWDSLIPLPWPLFAHADEGKLLVICIQITPPCAYHLDKLILEPNKNPRCSSHQPNIRYVPIPNNSTQFQQLAQGEVSWYLSQDRSGHIPCAGYYSCAVVRWDWRRISTPQIEVLPPGVMDSATPAVPRMIELGLDFKNRNRNWPHRDGDQPSEDATKSTGESSNMSGAGM